MVKFRIWIAAASIFMVSGCAFFMQDRIHYSWAPETAMPCTDCAPDEMGTTLVGIALSGGGSRASVYGAAALEILAEEGILQRASYLSSVSGGGFPATYYALNKPELCPAPSTELDCDQDAFFRFKQTMRNDFLSAMTFRQIEKPNRISSPTRRLSSLQDALDTAFLQGATFADLPKWPVLLLNGARYDDARRFVFSNVAIPDEGRELGQFSESTLRTASFSQPGCTRPTPAGFPVALAAAISAGFPPVLGPAAIEMKENCTDGAPRYWHLGDGGILDNSGVETIEDYALRAVTEGQPVKRVIIFSIDAGRRSTPETMMKQRNLKLWTTDPGRVVDIVGRRAEAYRQIALEQLSRDADVAFTVVKLRYTDAELDAWPAACDTSIRDAASLRDTLSNVPTSLKITDCHAELMEKAAMDVVRRGLREHSKLLDEVLQIAPVG